MNWDTKITQNKFLQKVHKKIFHFKMEDWQKN